MRPTRVLLGRIVGAHGVRGEVKIASYTEMPEAIAAYGVLEDEAGRPLRLTLKGRAKDVLLAALEGVATREAADALKGHALYVPRGALPDPGGDTYVADLVGLTVRMGTGQVLGRVCAVQEFGAGPLLEVAPEAGGETVLVPFTDDVVPCVAVEDGFVEVNLPPGLWPGTDREDAAGTRRAGNGSGPR